MDLISKLKGLNVVGWGNVALAVMYGFKKKKIEASSLKLLQQESLNRVSIGMLKSHELLKNGIKLDFDKASVEIICLADDTIRVTWTPGKLPVPYAIAKSDWSDDGVKIEEKDGWHIKTDKLSFSISENGSIEFGNKKGALRQEPAPTRTGQGWLHEATLKDDEHIYGLGQRNHDLNLRGGSYSMWNEEPMGDYGEGSDPIYVCVPAYMGLNEQGSYLVFYENFHKATFNFRDKAQAEFSGGALRYYFMIGDAPKLMNKFSELIGNPAMPPKWALGYHQTRWSYKTEEETLEVANGFKEHSLPISVIHLDIHYMDEYRVFTVDKNRFPDLNRLSTKLEEQGIKTVTILDPGIKEDPDYNLYVEGMDKEYFCTTPDGEVIKGPVWPGTCAFPDFTNPEVRKWWGSQYRKLLDQGVVGFWHDMNEPAVFSGMAHPTLPINTVHNMDGHGGNHLEAHNLYGLLENKAAFDGLQELQPDKRPWLLTRSGTASIQRYAWNWTGDTGCNWWSVKHNLKLALMLSLSGIPYTGSDIGGFNGDPSSELYIRWFEMSSFMPFFRTHSAAFVKRREPWSFGEEITDIARKYLNLRYELMPYWYTLAWEAHTSGSPLVRPVWWNQSQDKRLWDIEDEFMLGDSFLVAPILEEGQTKRKVIIPDGWWYSFWDESWNKGNEEIEVRAELDKLPLYVKAGSLIPTEKDNRLILKVYLHEEMPDTSAKLYSDAGDGYGDSRVDEFAVCKSADGWEITRTDSGKFEFPYDGIDLEVHGAVLKEIIVDQKSCEPQDKVETGLFDKIKIIAE